MQLFHNDYNQSCHPLVLERICCAQSQHPGYGADEHCLKAAGFIRELCNNQSLAVHFLCGGTQTNLTVIAASLRPHQAVISADSAHIHVHETGAIEATGHKVITLESSDGKINAHDVRRVVEGHRESADAEHMAQPKLVYISNPTEFGTIYTLDELESLSRTCRQFGLYLYVDGARMGYGLAASDNDITLADFARLCDIFYIGGTKVGAMFGEAVVIANPVLNEDFRYLVKQRGGMLAKGWLLGQQFEVLFEDGLYLKISKHADILADRIRNTLLQLGCPPSIKATTNQVFVVLPNDILEKLAENFSFSVWEKMDDMHTMVRFCTSWATTEESVDALCKELANLLG